MTLTFTKAEKKKAKLRLAIFGPSGAGKTYTALRIGKGMGGKIAVIDTENDSASLYADRFEFDTLNLQDKSIDGVCAAFKAAAEAGYEVVIIDSMSHAWQELLDQVDALASTKFRGNSHAAWSEGTPKQRQFVRAILETPFHLIGTMRSKTLWTEEEDTKTGKKKPVKLGLAPEQGKGIEFEFTMLMEMDVDHRATVTKDRTGKYQDKSIMKPGEDLGKELLEWLNSGKATLSMDEAKQLHAAARAKGIPNADLLKHLGVTKLGDLTADKLPAAMDWIEEQGADLALGEIEALIKLEIPYNNVVDYIEGLPYAKERKSVASHLAKLRAEKTPEQLHALFKVTAAA